MSQGTPRIVRELKDGSWVSPFTVVVNSARPPLLSSRRSDRVTPTARRQTVGSAASASVFHSLTSVNGWPP